MNERYIRIKGDVVVGVPPRLRCLTTWVLLEQEDWFEKEIAFIRSLLRPGMRAVDVGANLGVYALTIAKLVGPGGKVWAFEPTSETAAALHRSIGRNGFQNLKLLQIALSDGEGTAELFRYARSELNSLVHDQNAEAGGSETVKLSNLDRQQAELDWGRIDFIKIDAEGSGAKILAGGRGFFATQSPLVMFEANDSISSADQALPDAFRTLGYDVYRLVGPDTMLAPVAAHDPLRNYDLNLFACKPDRAARLAAAGLLAAEPAVGPICPDGAGRELYSHQAYAATFGALPSHTTAYHNALNAYALWRDLGAAPDLRLGALNRALAAARDACREKSSCARLATLARVALEAGDRQLAIDVLWHLLQSQQSGGGPVDEPFFPPASRYDMIDPKDRVSDWFTAATIEAFEQARFYSGFFIPAESRQLGMLDWLQSTPFASAPMERRRQLQRWAAGLQPGLEAALLTASAGV